MPDHRNAGRMGNRRATRLKCRHRMTDPMQSYDRLPKELRVWLSEAILPWSPASAQRLYRRALARGKSREMALQELSQAESRLIAKDRHLTLA